MREIKVGLFVEVGLLALKGREGEGDMMLVIYSCL
jgi:hypothetical protein